MSHPSGWNINSGAWDAPSWEGTPHLIIFTACLVILAASLILTPAQSETGPIRLGSMALPGLCIFNSLTGLPCPGCGLVRSMVAAAHGHVGQSVTHHRMGLITLANIFLQFIYSVLWLLMPSLRTALVRRESLLNRGWIALGGLYLVNWGITLILIGSHSY